MDYVQQVKIRNFQAFKEETQVDFCSGINVLLGGNGSGKTTLMKVMYNAYVSSWKLKKLRDKEFRIIPEYSTSTLRTSPDGEEWICEDRYGDFALTSDGEIVIKMGDVKLYYQPSPRDVSVDSYDKCDYILPMIYIPEKDILEHAKGLLPFIAQKDTGFSAIYKNILLLAQDIYTKTQTDIQQKICNMIADLVDGKMEWDASENTYYMLKTDGTRIPFSNEASGYKKLAYLGHLVACGHLESGSVLFWDEPENSLNPELSPLLVNILVELAKSGVQVFLATHDYNIARYIDIRKEKSVPVLFHNLKKTDQGIHCTSEPNYLKLQDNLLESTSAELFQAVVTNAMEEQEDEAELS